MKQIFRAGAVAVVLFGLFAWCPAPVLDKPEGAKFHPEHSAREMGRFQNGKIGPSEGPDPAPHPAPDAEAPRRPKIESSGPSQTESLIAQSDPQRQAARTVADSQRSAQAPSEGPGAGSTLIGIFGLMIALGIGAVIAKAAQARLPQPPPKKKIKL